MFKTFIGIDPGASGGICWVTDAKHRQIAAYEARIHKMPETDADIVQLLTEARDWLHDNRPYAVLEKVHSMPGQGVASTFKFGASYGRLRMALVALGIPFEEATPQRWMKYMNCLTKGDKNVSKARAQELFPEHRKKIIHATADALLIAEYCRRIREE